MASLNTLETMNSNGKNSHNPNHESTNINEEKQSYSAPKVSQSNGDVNETVIASDDEYAIDADPISYSTPSMQRGRKRRTLQKSIVIGNSSIKISLPEPERTEIEAMDAQWCTEGGEYLPMSKLLDGWTEEKRRRVDTGTIDKFYHHNYSSKTYRSMVEVQSYIKHHSDPHKKNSITLGDSQERNQAFA
ncbi:uncharacterized protein LOC110905265 [Helianthus annuus]|uniref:uncharacterized protein LOC110905265 n=1 Tax=Helianthus annuus TaxID=4232 RepID=UPI000B903F75|nr:uncharacterized protein LOC110905265 [Helianthus annuus]